MAPFHFSQLLLPRVVPCCDMALRSCQFRFLHSLTPEQQLSGCRSLENKPKNHWVIPASGIYCIDAVSSKKSSDSGCSEGDKRIPLGMMFPDIFTLDIKKMHFIFIGGLSF